MSFAAPEAFLLLLLPFLVLFLRPAGGRTAEAAYLPPALAARLGKPGAARGRVRDIAPALVWLCLVLAVAGPRRVEVLDIVPASGRDIILAIDLSGSMEKEDFTLDGTNAARLDAVKRVAARFVSGRAGDRVGLVVFGDRAYVAAPLTHDVASVVQAVQSLTIGVSGRSTAISDGLGLAMKRLEDDRATSRVIVLLSDGTDTTGAVAPVEAASLAAELGIRIHTIALGTEDSISMPNRADAVDVETLQEVADTSGGRMFRVRTTEELVGVAAAVDALEPGMLQAPPIRSYRQYWMWPAGAAVVLSLLALLLGRGQALPRLPGRRIEVPGHVPAPAPAPALAPSRSGQPGPPR